MQGLLIVVSGFSGVGKGTLMKELLTRYPEQYALSVSATSRAPRTGEKDGEAYFFKTREEFLKMAGNGELLEYAEYNGNFYGTPKQYVLDQMKTGRNVILEIEVQGGQQIKKIFPEAFLLYVVPPSAKELKNRLNGRGTETEDVINSRLKRAVSEADYVMQYDFVTVNDDFERCLNEIHETILKQQEITDVRRRYIAAIKEELLNLTNEEN